MQKELYNHITVVISTRNAADYIHQCLMSALGQKYPSYNIIFLDACSDDGTYEKALDYVGATNNLTVMQNEKRKYQGENIRIGTEMAPPGSIIVTLDGDDWFPHEMVLATVNEAYNKYDCWMTYGTYVEFPYRDVSNIYHEYPIDVRREKKFRQYSWLASHLRTFRRELFLRINPDDMKDPKTGDYVSMAPDLSFQFPMLEMCGTERSKYLPDILYVYNRSNPLNEAKIDQSEINRIEKHLRSLPPYETLGSLYE